MKFLADVNVLLPLLVDRHAHREPALAWFDGVGADEVALCRVTQLGVLRLLCSRLVMREDVLTPVEAWGAWRWLAHDERTTYAEEPRVLDVNLRAYVEDRVPTPNLWTDAYLAGFAAGAGLEMVTFDKGFRSFPRLKLQLLDGNPAAP